MPGETQVVQSPRTRPVTRRTSIRQSLNLASVSKAFADVINKSDKDTKDASKPSKKTKDSRRLSAQPAKPTYPRTSMGDVRSPSQAPIRTATPESKGSTRRRGVASISNAPSDEQPPRPESASSTPKAQQVGVVTRAASFRAKNASLATSSLPKYRPKLAVTEQPKPPSPVTVRAGTRRRLSCSDDSEKEEKQRSVASSTVPAEKVDRPISPLPLRAALKALNTSPAPTPPTPTSNVPTPTSSRSSPPRPSKTHKSSTSVSAVPRPSSSSSGSAGPRPPSSSSSNSNPPQTPQTPVVRSLRRTLKEINKQSPASGVPPESPSPPARHVRGRSNAEVGNMSHISERADEDEDELEDVELLLAPVAKLGAPTPAMPRIQKVRSCKPPVPPPKTPSRASLPTRENMSYLSPLPPGEGEFGEISHLRPPQIHKATSNALSAGRGSILSWEQLASEASKTLGQDELDKMLHDIPAPFRSGAASPALTATLEIPASPCLSALDSPTGYGSISQVLLPDVTPSPAMHGSQRYNLSHSEGSSVESPVTNLLRLQLAQAETMAKERLMQMQAMEKEIHELKEMHARKMQETARHIAHLEVEGRRGEDTRAYAVLLENRLRQAEALREQSVREATRKSEESVRRSLDSERRKERAFVRVSYAAKVAASEWANVKDLAEVELDLVRGDRAVLSILLVELDQLTQMLS
ncbi:hypothetical protein AN958_01197 [Leucoagaricus sp. SymC.cos]|nr:hypothetical protein AN958_01197 [Leucoagaricus sp. SymC.cos]